MRSRYLICYDIADERRLTRVYRYLKDRGVHMQYSVFLCSLTWPELESVKADLGAMIDEASDDVRLYPLPSREAIEALGRGMGSGTDCRNGPKGAAHNRFLTPCDGALVILP
jgi:CRISPR-associated protein Cas2